MSGITSIAMPSAHVGGALIIALVATGIAAPSIVGTTPIGAIPTALAALGILLFEIETRNWRLEEIVAEEFKGVSAQGSGAQ
jgi:hypothetical protein